MKKIKTNCIGLPELKAQKAVNQMLLIALSLGVFAGGLFLALVWWNGLL